MKKLALALGLVVVSTGASAALPEALTGSLVVPVVTTVVVAGVAVAAANNGGSSGTTGTVPAPNNN